jgi:periplasmic protein CpxP/Spy
MRRERLLTIAVVFLLVLNIGIVGYLAFARLGPPPHPELFKMVVRELNLNDQQQQQYFALRDDHRRAMNALDDEFAEGLKQYLLQLRPAAPDSVRMEFLENRLAAIEKEKAKITFLHFKEVRALCNPGQQKDFDRIVPQLTRVLLPPKKQHQPRRN